MSMICEAATFAANQHKDQLYGHMPYVVHVCEVVRVLQEFHYDDVDLLAAGFLHDVVEDCNVGLDEIESKFGSKVSRLVDAVTGIGSNRRERKADMLSKLIKYPKAVPLKMADRLANMRSCSLYNPRMLEMYAKEIPDYDALFKQADPAMDYHINKLVFNLGAPQ